MGIVGKNRISRVANVTDQGLAVFAGLGKMPDPSFLHDFLDEVIREMRCESNCISKLLI